MRSPLDVLSPYAPGRWLCEADGSAMPCSVLMPPVDGSAMPCSVLARSPCAQSLCPRSVAMMPARRVVPRSVLRASVLAGRVALSCRAAAPLSFSRVHAASSLLGSYVMPCRSVLRAFSCRAAAPLRFSRVHAGSSVLGFHARRPQYWCSTLRPRSFDPDAPRSVLGASTLRLPCRRPSEVQFGPRFVLHAPSSEFRS